MPKAGDWTYAPEGTAYPVKPGDVWQAGPHLIACADLETEAGRAFLTDRLELPTMIYVDPPWNSGNATTFRTKAGLPARVNFEQFIMTLLAVTRTSRGPVIMEMGNQSIALVAKKVIAQGGRVVATWPITYYKKHPTNLLLIDWHSKQETVLPAVDFSGQDDEDTPLAAIEYFSQKGDLVMDPCTGRGLTAVSADVAGRRFIGTELSPHRLSVTLSKLAARGHAINQVGGFLS